MRPRNHEDCNVADARRRMGGPGRRLSRARIARAEHQPQLGIDQPRERPGAAAEPHGRRGHRAHERLRRQHRAACGGGTGRHEDRGGTRTARPAAARTARIRRARPRMPARPSLPDLPRRPPVAVPYYSAGCYGCAAAAGASSAWRPARRSHRRTRPPRRRTYYAAGVPAQQLGGDGRGHTRGDRYGRSRCRAPPGRHIRDSQELALRPVDPDALVARDDRKLEGEDSMAGSGKRRFAKPSRLLGVMLAALGMASGSATAGGLIAYEVGTADVGLASAGYSARAQDASTVLTNPAGMTRLDGNQLLITGQVLWANEKFSIGSGTSPELGKDDGGHIVGQNGWFLGGGPFYSYSVSPDLKLGFALTGQFRRAAQLRRQLGRPLLRAGGDDPRDLVPAVDRVQGQRQALRRRDAQRDVRHLPEPGGDQQRAAGLPGRHAADAGRDVGLGRHARRAVPGRRAHPPGAHVDVADEPRLQRSGGVQQPRARRPRAAASRAGCSIRASRSASRCRSR